jgi:REP element-mobilizing transposase RayT
MNHQHRNSQKRFYGDCGIYFITTVADKRYPYFKEDLFCELLIENLRLCKELKEVELYAFVVILDHLHLLLKQGENFNISKIMQFLKRHFSRDMNYILNTSEGDIRECRLQGGEYNQFAEIINSHDKKLKAIKGKFINKYTQHHNFPKFKWQKSFIDHLIRNEKDLLNHLNYVNFNCVKHGICEKGEDYKWSSLNREFEDFVGC